MGTTTPPLPLGGRLLLAASRECAHPTTHMRASHTEPGSLMFVRLVCRGRGSERGSRCALRIDGSAATRPRNFWATIASRLLYIYRGRGGFLQMKLRLPVRLPRPASPFHYSAAFLPASGRIQPLGVLLPLRSVCQSTLGNRHSIINSEFTMIISVPTMIISAKRSMASKSYLTAAPLIFQFENPSDCKATFNRPTSKAFNAASFFFRFCSSTRKKVYAYICAIGNIPYIIFLTLYSSFNIHSFLLQDQLFIPTRFPIQLFYILFFKDFLQTFIIILQDS
jgi:hypothetical protein